MHRTNANKSIREAHRTWQEVKDSITDGRLFDIANEAGSPLLPDREPGSGAGEVHSNPCTHHGTLPASLKLQDS